MTVRFKRYEFKLILHKGEYKEKWFTDVINDVIYFVKSYFYPVV